MDRRLGTTRTALYELLNPHLTLLRPAAQCPTLRTSMKSRKSTADPRQMGKYSVSSGERIKAYQKIYQLIQLLERLGIPTEWDNGEDDDPRDAMAWKEWIVRHWPVKKAGWSDPDPRS